MILSSYRLSYKLTSSITGGVRSVSSSPYGRTHVWRRRAPKLPNPVVPHFPQRVTLADGSTFIQWTTSPRPSIKLTRDTTNNPVWNPWLAGSNPEDVEGAAAGRMGRFRRRFEELGGVEMSDEWVVMESAAEEDVVGVPIRAATTPTKSSKK